jgi:hypothetical protein
VVGNAAHPERQKAKQTMNKRNDIRHSPKLDKITISPLSLKFIPAWECTEVKE